jgi:hypothetical protein
MYECMYELYNVPVKCMYNTVYARMNEVQPRQACLPTGFISYMHAIPTNYLSSACCMLHEYLDYLCILPALKG